MMSREYNLNEIDKFDEAALNRCIHMVDIVLLTSGPRSIATSLGTGSHLNSEHCLDDRSTAQARVQMQVVSQLEMHLQKERDRLQAMMHHLYLIKQFLSPENRQIKEGAAETHFKNSMTMSTTSSMTTPTTISPMPSSNMSSSNIATNRKRIGEKASLSLTGGLSYMLERAGLDVQQEIQRNREFYKNADVRPPFTYASLIRQSIIESPDKQLTLNEIYNWFQNTFCYFRRNAATWKFHIGSKAELKQRLVEHLGKEKEDLFILEFEYNIKGREQTDDLGGTENTATAREKHSEEKSEDGANAVVMQFMQQMQQMQQQTQQMQQQGQQIQSKVDGTTEKIYIVQENQRILQTHIDEMYQQFEGKVKVVEEKVGNAIGQLDARINGQKKDVKNEIKA
uniref:Fork-head domain-containing protein n=1 Tax=Glossina austeni TaxID=7395 RepID=A0A1A9UZ74_GLOAU